MNSSSKIRSQEDVVASLTVRLSRIEREFAEYKAETDAMFTEIAAQLDAKGCGCSSGNSNADYVKVASGSVTDRIPSFITRDDVVRRAIADIEGVKTPWNINADPQPLVYVSGIYVVDVEFVINREKRTVAAIARWRRNNEVVARGIAKCAPGDVFNVHIGRAIALRRALALPVPQEYVKCPQLAEGDVRVGDVVTWRYTNARYSVLSLKPMGEGQANLRGIWFEGKSTKWEAYAGSFTYAKVIDDSARYDSEVLA